MVKLKMEECENEQNTYTALHSETEALATRDRKYETSLGLSSAGQPLRMENRSEICKALGPCVLVLAKRPHTWPEVHIFGVVKATYGLTATL